MNELAGYDRAKELFLAAYELTAAERVALLDRECADDEALRQRVEQLLALDSAATSVGDTTGYEGPSAYDRPLPERIGPYRVTGVIGEGGMGTVYEAVQRRPQRRVALKVIRGALATTQAMRRFEREVELLGRLRHPQMAQIYDAGVHHEDGRQNLPLPYFALELVNGKPITEYVIDNQLSVSDRLRLVIRICDAVGYAHRKGVIHLDLKPGNILVDYAGHPKILDFGIARATEQDQQEAPDPDRPRLIMGTVPYMSPEQIRGEPQEIDTRSDIYALGALCYELLARKTPHGTEGMSPGESVEAVLETDPIPINDVAPQRVPRDLERIILKALHRSRELRYQTTQELAHDLQRFLSGLPVSVTPHTAWYVSRRFAARHRVLVAAALIAVVVVLGMSARLASLSVAAHQVGEQRDAMRGMVESLLLDPLSAAPAEARIDNLIQWRQQVSPLLDPTDPLPAMINLAIGRAMMLDGDHAEAREILVPAAERLMTQLGWTDSRSRAAAAIVSECFERLNDPDQAQWWKHVALGEPTTDPSQ